MLLIWLSVSYLQGNSVKDTTTIIMEWVETEQIIGKESTLWNIEKEALLDIRNVLVKELEELNQRLTESEEEAVGSAKQRAELMSKKDEIERTTYSILESVNDLQNNINEIFKLLPTPLAERLHPFREKLSLEISDSNLPLRQRIDTLISLLQAIFLFHRNVSLERQEFSLEDNVSREFQVIYFGLGIAYFVNESGTIAGYGSPSKEGWKWNRQDSLAQEISTGVDILNNRAMPRFLNLPFPQPRGSRK